MDNPQCPYCDAPRKLWGGKYTKTCGGTECKLAAKRAHYASNRGKAKAYREANKEKIAAKERAWREANKEKLQAKRKAYYEANKEEFLAKCKEYREANKDEALARNKAYREANREELAAKQRAYQKANRDERAAYGRAYYESNREEITKKSKAYRQTPSGKAVKSRGSARRRNAKRNAQGLITPTVDAVAARDGLKCYLCGKTCYRGNGVGGATVDHLVPVSKGGLHCMSNAALACRSCNSAKNAAFSPDENLFHQLMLDVQRQTEEIMDLAEENNG